MSSSRNRTGKPLDEDQALSALMRVAGPRPEISDEIRQRVYDRALDSWIGGQGPAGSDRVYGKVLRAWRRNTAWVRHRGWMLPAGAAASALIAFLFIGQPAPTPRISVATITKSLASGVQVDTPRRAVFAGEAVSTGPDEGLSLLLAGGESLRMDGNSSIRLVSRTHLVLLGGRVYADTGDFVYRDGGLLIDTGFGSVRDIGTQFAVALSDSVLDVAVREGRVDVEQGSGKLIAIAGERLLVTADGNTQTQDVAPNAEFWAWSTALAPEFDIAGKSLLDFLKWVARETGMELEFGGDDTRLSAMRTDLHGTVAGIAPLEALALVMETTAFRYRIEDTRIVVDR